MQFKIEETVDVGGGSVEVRARLEDGRLAITTLPKGSDYDSGVAAYLEESANAQAAAEAAMRDAAKNA